LISANAGFGERAFDRIPDSIFFFAMISPFVQ